VQRMAAGDQDAIRELKWALNKDTAQPALMNNLLYGYLPDLGQVQLIEQLQHEWTLPVPAIGVETQNVFPF